MFSLQSPESVSRQLGARLRALRLARNVSQADLARMTGASLSSIRRLEAAGQSTLVLLVRVAQALHAADALDDLFASTGHSIAQAEALAQAGRRQRARRAALPAGATEGDA